MTVVLADRCGVHRERVLDRELGAGRRVTACVSGPTLAVFEHLCDDLAVGAKGRPARNFPVLRSPDGRQRHCWVLLANTDTTAPCAGLVLEWKQTSKGEWLARVVYVPPGELDVSVEAWVNARHLRSADRA